MSLTFLENSTARDIAEMYIVFQVYSALIQSLPSPTDWPKGGIWYKAIYNFLSILAADFKSFIANKAAQAGKIPSTTIQSPGSGQ